MKSSDKRMTAERCAVLTWTAVVNKLEEAWICFFPVLPIMYFSQYMPTVAKRFGKYILKTHSDLRPVLNELLSLRKSLR
jgi:hypothetical protein